jgi:hypothetical protein
MTGIITEKAVTENHVLQFDSWKLSNLEMPKEKT